MKILNYKNKIINTRAGFSIVELLIALAISALLLTAIAVAFNGSVKNYQENEDLYRAINNARQALFRITTQLRTGNLINPDDPDNRCSFFTADNKDITYEYRTADKKLYLVTNYDTSDSDYVLCDNVTAMSFIKTPTGTGDCKSVQISMTVQINGVPKTLSAATVIRKNLK
jgi:prepilin-type N-terminal cleavage/methylation domain-containing protein